MENKKIIFVSIFLLLFVLLFFYLYNNYSYIYFKEKSQDKTSFNILKNFVLENYKENNLFSYPYIYDKIDFATTSYYCNSKTFWYNRIFSDLYLFNISSDNIFVYDYVPCFKVFYFYLENEGYPLTINLKLLYENKTLFNNDIYPHYYSYVYVFKFNNNTDAKKFYDFLSYAFNSESFNKNFLEHYFYKNIDEIPFYTNVNAKEFFYYKNWVIKDNYSFFHHTLVILKDDKVLISKTFTNNSTVKYYVSSI